jgi:sugar phosphate isomerase/epimerase
MRLGAVGGRTGDPRTSFFRAERTAELYNLAEKLDRYGLGAIPAPIRTAEMTDEECIVFGEKAASLDIVISEVHFLKNLMAPDPETRRRRVEEGRALLRKSDLLRARCLLGFAGSADPRDSIAVPAAYNYTDAFKSELRELVLRVLDGVELEWTKYGLEASPKSFFYGVEGCAELISAVDHPDFGIHLDMMNMVSQDTYFTTTTLIEQTFAVLGDKIFAAHLKDISWDWEYQFLKFDECMVGDGDMDYEAFLKHLANMDPDFPCMCEHLEVESDFITSFERLHSLADALGLSWRGRRVAHAS